MSGLVIDSFAGGGGASLGISLAIGREPDIAINHDAEAIAMHECNHPRTLHIRGDIWEQRPKDVCKGRPVAMLWASPDCTHHSKAKGGKPRSNERRGLAWVVIRWARDVRPGVIFLENVEEFQNWGPLTDEGMPDKARKGQTFKRWVGQLRALGYVVEWRELRACDFGAPTIRKRLFLVARCDGLPIAWPEPTHGPGRIPYRTAAECIDWSFPCPSIFDRAKPLAEATMRRIARGIRKFVIDAADPFIVRGGDGVISPSLVQTGQGERKGQAPRCLDIQKPLGTVVACGGRHALVTAFLAKHYGGHEGSGSSLTRPIDTITTQDHHALVLAFLMKYYGTSTGSDLNGPMPTVMAGAEHLALVTVNGEKYTINDIGMRMLSPRELFRAQGFPDSYVIDIAHGTRKALTKTAQIRLAGNSVCPPVARALVEANTGVQPMQAAA